MDELEEIDVEIEEMNALWDKAIYNARKAFEDTFNNEGYDAAYWTIKIISHSMSTSFDAILQTKTWDEYGNYKLKELIEK